VQALVRPHHILPRQNDAGDWAVTRISATGPQARILLKRADVTCESAMTADALLESGLKPEMRVDVSFTGATLFGLDDGLLGKMLVPEIRK
jgi:hypothetical protein